MFATRAVAVRRTPCRGWEYREVRESVQVGTCVNTVCKDGESLYVYFSDDELKAYVFKNGECVCKNDLFVCENPKVASTFSRPRSHEEMLPRGLREYLESEILNRRDLDRRGA